MLSRKYYEQFAEILRTSNSKEEIKEKLIEMFRYDNPRFDTMRFRKKAGEVV